MWKIFESLIYNHFFQFFIENNLIESPSLKQGDSCICQSLSRTHEIYQPFDDAIEVKDNLLDISKAQIKFGIKVFLNCKKMGDM